MLSGDIGKGNGGRVGENVISAPFFSASNCRPLQPYLTIVSDLFKLRLTYRGGSHSP